MCGAVIKAVFIKARGIHYIDIMTKWVSIQTNVSSSIE